VNAGDVDLHLLIKTTSRFTPADMEYLFQQVAQYAFEQELATKQDYQVTTATILEIIPKIRPTLTEDIIREFEKDSLTFARF
jgi:transitional endoplasmic reticulum ATPase